MIRQVIRNSRGQAMVETAISVIFLTMACFAAIQFYMIAVGMLRANEAAFSACRCAVVSKGSTTDGALNEKPEDRAKLAAWYILGLGLPPQAVTVWQKPKIEKGESSWGKDHSSGEPVDANGKGADIRAFTAMIYYQQKIMFSRFFPGLATANRLSVSTKYGPTGVASSRQIKSPDWKYYDHAYPGARQFQ
jgi:hypothetical protein